MYCVARGVCRSLQGILRTKLKQRIITSSIAAGRYHTTYDDEFDARYENYFSKPDIDSWQLRKAMNDLTGEDVVPEPKIIIAAMKACRRLNDYAVAVRYLEAVKHKCGHKEHEIWPYILQEIKPTLEELGILTPEEMGYNKPELAMQNVFEYRS